VPFSTFNIAFICFIVIGYLVVLLLWKRQKGVDLRALTAYEELKAAKSAENKAAAEQ
jgi:hypothetical protein